MVQNHQVLLQVMTENLWTVVTTIGYGHTAPVTKAGQAFC